MSPQNKGVTHELCFAVSSFGQTFVGRHTLEVTTKVKGMSSQKHQACATQRQSCKKSDFSDQTSLERPGASQERAKCTRNTSYARHNCTLFVFNDTWLLNFPGLTWHSSHHILTPPFATLSERMKYSLLSVRHRVQVLANLAIVLITPGGERGTLQQEALHTSHPRGRGEIFVVQKRSSCCCGNSQALGAKENASRCLPRERPVGARPRPHGARHGTESAGAHALPLPFPQERRPRPLSEALPSSAPVPPRPGKLTAEVVEAGEIHDLSPKSHGGAQPAAGPARRRSTARR